MLPTLHFVSTKSRHTVSVQGVKRSHSLPPPSEYRFTVAKGFHFTSEAHVLTDLSPTLQTYFLYTRRATHESSEICRLCVKSSKRRAYLSVRCLPKRVYKPPAIGMQIHAPVIDGDPETSSFQELPNLQDSTGALCQRRSTCSSFHLYIRPDGG